MAPPAGVGDCAYRVLVSGLKRGPVRRHRGGIVEEDDLGYLFYDRGCAVDGVRLVVDPRTDRSRGFGFVDFEDQASLEKALAMNGQVTMGEGGPKLTVEVARPASDDTKRRERELAQVKNRTEEMERELRLREARVKELMREVQRKRERQQQVISSARDVEVELKGELERQAKIRSAVQSLKEAEETLSSAFRAEEERTHALEAIIVSVDGQQTQQHAEVGATSDADSHPQESSEQAVSKAEGSGETKSKQKLKGSVTVLHSQDVSEAGLSEDDEVLGTLQVRVKNTFLHYYVPHGEENAIPRTKTAPELTHSVLGGQEGGLTTMPGFTQPVLSPWMLKREASAAEVSRMLLEEKMGGHELPHAPSSGLVVQGGSVQASGAVTPAAAGARAPAARRLVRLKNVPQLPQSELEELLREELARLWKAARGRPPPAIVEFRVSGREPGRTFAQVAAGTDALVLFADADDAAWLVDGRAPASWSRLDVISLCGRMLQAEWASPMPMDWRRLRYQADTDASSNLSYGTVGTRRSFSSHIGAHAGGAEGIAESPTAAAKRGSAGCPRRNRTVILEGIPVSWPANQVVDEVLALLCRLWHHDGLTFNAKEQLHTGGDGGVVVRPARRSGDENGGSCLVRLRTHLDAKWLVEGSVGQLSVGGDAPLKALWARPRQGQQGPGGRARRSGAA